MPSGLPCRVRQLGLADYLVTWQAMRDFTDQRSAQTVDEIWLVEHHPVFTQGQAGRAEHVLAAGDIPLVQTDRGGQVTYHGPGQLVVYPLLALKRLGLGVRDWVTCIERTVVATLAEYGVESYSKADAPGVYVGGKKIASLGLRVRRGSSYHGVAINLDMDLSPFARINPCGYEGLMMTQLVDELAKQGGAPELMAQFSQRFLSVLAQKLSLELQFDSEETLES